MNKKILTIIVPSYNMEKYLLKCLGSLEVEPKLMERLEVLVVNDGSKDRTSEIAHEFAEKWRGTFKVIDKANGHYGSCINAALPVATGEYIKILDADDHFDTGVFSEYLEFLVKLCGQVHSPDVVFSDYRFVDEDGVIGSNWDGGRSLPLPQGEVFYLKDISNLKDVCQHHAIAYKTKILREIGYHQTEGVCYTDSEWVSIPMSVAETAIYYPQILYHYLMGREDQSMSKAVWDKNIWMMEHVAFNICKWVDQRNEFNKIKLQIPREFAYSMFRGIYYTCIFSPEPGRLSIDLRQTDSRLASEIPGFYERLGEELYSRRWKVKYIKVWRSRLPWSRLLIASCKLYTVLARFGRRK